MRYALGLATLAISLVTATCGSAQQPEGPHTQLWEPAATATTCANVESRLIDLQFSPDRPVFARDQELETDGTAVRVIIELHPGYPRPALPGVVERTDDRLVQALVSPDRLCEIGQQPEVRFVRPAFQPHPLGGIRRESGAR